MVFGDTKNGTMDKGQDKCALKNVRYINKKESVEYVCHVDNKGKKSTNPVGTHSTKADSPEQTPSPASETTGDKPSSRKVSRVRFAEEVETKTVEEEQPDDEEVKVNLALSIFAPYFPQPPEHPHAFCCYLATILSN